MGLASHLYQQEIVLLKISINLKFLFFYQSLKGPLFYKIINATESFQRKPIV